MLSGLLGMPSECRSGIDTGVVEKGSSRLRFEILILLGSSGGRVSPKTGLFIGDFEETLRSSEYGLESWSLRGLFENLGLIGVSGTRTFAFAAAVAGVAAGTARVVAVTSISSLSSSSSSSSSGMIGMGDTGLLETLMISISSSLLDRSGSNNGESMAVGFDDGLIQLLLVV